MDRFESIECGSVSLWDVNLVSLFGGFGPGSERLGIEIDPPPTAREMRTESSPDRGLTRFCTSRSLFLSFPNQVKTPDGVFPMFGPTPLVEIQRDGSVLTVASLSTTPRRFRPTDSSVSVINDDEAVDAARRQLRLDAVDYPRAGARLTLGYEQAPERCAQIGLRPTYEVRLTPTALAAARGRPSIVVRVDARRAPPGIPPTQEWRCAGWDGD